MVLPSKSSHAEKWELSSKERLMQEQALESILRKFLWPRISLRVIPWLIGWRRTGRNEEKHGM